MDAMEFIAMIAGMKQDREPNGTASGYVMEYEDTVLTLNALIAQARQILPSPAPTAQHGLVWVVTYTHTHGIDVGVYSSEAKAWEAVDRIKAETPEDFDEDDPCGWCDVDACVIDHMDY